MMKEEEIDRFIKSLQSTIEKMKEIKTKIKKIMNKINGMNKEKSLTIPFLAKECSCLDCEIGVVESEIRCQKSNVEYYWKRVNSKSHEEWVLGNWLEENYVFRQECKKYQEFKERYKNFMPANAEALKEEVRKVLRKKGYVVDSYFEGDYVEYIGVYARPEDKPTYLDPLNEEEFRLQEKYSVDGFKQDFAEWFEWGIKDGHLVEE